MPRFDSDYDHELMGRDRGDEGRGRGYFDEGGDRGAMFGGDRGELSMRRRQAGGWGSLMNDESSGGRGMSDRPENRRERSFGPDDDRRGIPTDETERLIASNKVEGTPVYGRNGDRLGSVYNFMVDKFRGHVVYAVLKHSTGFLGLDDRYYPLEWDQLTYDTRLGGYHVELTEDQLKQSGSWDKNERWSDRERGMGSGRGGLGRDRDSMRGRGSMRDRERERGMMREPW
jgi:hypothetical protein